LIILPFSQKLPYPRTSPTKSGGAGLRFPVSKYLSGVLKFNCFLFGLIFLRCGGGDFDKIIIIAK